MTYKITFESATVEPFDNETVLDALLRHGIDTPFSCKGGSCHSCLSQCVAGDIPEKAQQGLSERLRTLGYFLPCRCVPTSHMTLQRKQAKDMINRCMLIEVDGHESRTLRILFEAMTALTYRQGQTLRLVTGTTIGSEPLWMLSSNPETSVVLEARWSLNEGETIPDYLAPGAEFGLEFDVRGPFTLDFHDLPERTTPPSTDPTLWDELEQGKKARAVLDAFYAKVYADAQLAPFFAGVTQDRAASKQYNFLQQQMTGEKVYWGESPRNTHHWMVIPHSLLDHRQQLMIETLREHGLSDQQIARWTRFEEYYRSDIVKDKEWPKRIGQHIVSMEGFAEETLGEATLCDQCQQEVLAGVTVLYHRRTGLISCPNCAQRSASPA